LTRRFLHHAARRGPAARGRRLRQEGGPAADVGYARSGDELAGKAVAIDAPRGMGRILLFASNPMWRGNAQGMYALVMNAVLNWDGLR
jgi:hypothetical protein